MSVKSQITKLKELFSSLSAKMSNPIAAQLRQIEATSTQSKGLVDVITNQLSQLEAAAVLKQKDDLKKENEQLRKKLNELTAQLVALETKRGKVQYYDFCKNDSATATAATATVSPLVAEVKAESEVNGSAAEAPKPSQQADKKIKKEKPAKKAGGAAKKQPEAELPVDVSRLDFRVGRIISAEKHPDAESLYVEQIDVGEAVPRTVVSGLVRFVPLAEMQGRLVVLLCNLKPAKMRGVLSQAMVMCASTPDKVEILSPPADSCPGDLVEFPTFSRSPDALLNPKKKIFEACAPDLKTSADKVAIYKDAPMTVVGKGVVTAQTLASVMVK